MEDSGARARGKLRVEYSDVDRDRKLYLDFPSDLFNKDNSRNQKQESLDKS